MPQTANLARLVGMSVHQASLALGMPRYATAGWLNKQGYRLRDGRVAKIELPQEVERRIADRAAAAAPSAPCFRCGAARNCDHRSNAGGA